MPGMKLWLIEIIHNIDIVCNVVFWWMLAFYLIGYSKSRGIALNIGRQALIVWLLALIGVIFIPSKEVLFKISG